MASQNFQYGQSHQPDEEAQRGTSHRYGGQSMGTGRRRELREPGSSGQNYQYGQSHRATRESDEEAENTGYGGQSMGTRSRHREYQDTSGGGQNFQYGQSHRTDRDRESDHSDEENHTQQYGAQAMGSRSSTRHRESKESSSTSQNFQYGQAHRSTTSTASTEKEHFVMVAAIDFGTTFSGYAFSFKSSPEEIRMNKNWSENMGFQSYKAPTSVLTGPDGKFMAFGYEAEHMYTEILTDEELSGKHQMYRHFKMMLYSEKNVTRNTMIQSVSGQKRKASDIFVMALRYLKGNLIDMVRRLFAFNKSDESLIKWVITVPAIWRDEAKQFMREAAYEAELISCPDSRMLTIALEPEAASMFCRRLDIDHFVGGSDGVKTANFQTGTKYMVIDAGGGTVDITVHEVLPSNQVKEIHSANGGAWGGTQVDKNFVSLLHRVMGERFIEAYRKECPQQWLALMTNFEKVKKSAKPDGTSKLVIPLSWSMGHKHQELMGSGIESVIQKSIPLGVSFANGSLIIKQEAIKELFEPVVQEILAHVESLLRLPEVRDCSYFLLVGGFGECIFLQQAVEQAFGQRVCLLVPNEAQMSVIKGAVMFGHEPTAIKSRISRKTYGVKVCKTFEEGIHDPNKLEYHDGIANCTGIFDPFVQMGEEVPTGHTQSVTYHPATKDAKEVTIALYAAGRKIPKEQLEYVDSAGMEKIGSFIVQMPDTTGGRNRKIRLDIEFGGTEIQIDGTDETSGSKANTAIDFLTE